MIGYYSPRAASATVSSRPTWRGLDGWVSPPASDVGLSLTRFNEILEATMREVVEERPRGLAASNGPTTEEDVEP